MSWSWIHVNINVRVSLSRNGSGNLRECRRWRIVYGIVPFSQTTAVLYHRPMKSLLTVVFLAVVVAAAEKTPDKTPRMRDGHPDLSGNWSYATLTTLERPRELGNKAFLTGAEAAAFEKKTLTVQNRDRRDGEGPDGRGPDGRTDLDRAYG